MSDPPQQALARAAQERGVALSALSRMLGRNQAYLSQFVHRGSPRLLPERERRLLADFLAIDERRLGAPDRDGDEVAVPWLTVAAAAGDGRAAEERVIRHELLPRTLLRDAGVAPGEASLVNVAGESMAPTLLDRDRLLVDAGDRVPPPGGAIYVVRVEGELAVKRLVRDRAHWRLVSDNPAWPERRLPRGEVTVIGRARLLLRGL